MIPNSSEFSLSEDTPKKFFSSLNQCILRQGCNYNNPPCGSGQQCQNNACVTPAPSCTNQCTNGARICSGNGFQFCSDYNGDGCTEWGSVQSCGGGQVCSGQGQCVNAMAGLSLEFSDVTYQFDEQHYYYHTRTIRESNGVDVTLISGTICSQSSGCINSPPLSYRVSGSLILTNQNFYTPYDSDGFTLTYYGNDIYGNPVSVSASMTVSGSQHNP